MSARDLHIGDHAAPIPTVSGPCGPDDPVAARLCAYRLSRERYESVRDGGLVADRQDRLADVLTLLEADMLVARHRLEHTPPCSAAGLALLLRHILTLTDDPHVAAAVKACLAGLLGLPPSFVAVEEGEDGPPDDVFDGPTGWALDG
jgi:hypothetical protein